MGKLREHKVEDYLKSRNIPEVMISPDGSKAALTITGVFKNFREEIDSEVALLSLRNKNLRYLSRKGWTSYSPAFSRSGNKLAYLSRKGEEQRMVLNDLDNETVEEIVLEGAADLLRWADDTTLLVSIKDKDQSAEEKKAGDDGFFFEEEPRFDSLWSYRVGSGLRRITKGIQVWEFDANSRVVAAITSALPYEWSWYEADISLIDVDTGSVRKIYHKKDRQVAKPRLSPDNRKLLFLESLWSDRGVNSGDVMSIEIRGRESRNLTEGDERSYSEMQWRDEEKFLTLSNEDGRFSIYLFKGGKKKELWAKYGSVHRPWSPTFSASGDIAVVSFENWSQPNELLLIDLKNGKEKGITSINSYLEGCRRYPSQKISWKSTDGLEITGIFRSAGKGSPLMVIVHGGPTGSSADSFIGQSTLFLSQGYSVFLPNYRGSVGRGRKFAELNLGDMGGMDLKDILTGVDFLVNNMGVDRKRIFITGGSYGGFMSAWAITQTDLFKGAISLFGISDWVSFHGVSNLPTWDRIHYNEDPYKFNKFLKFSPLWYADRVKTPVLLAHGMEDPYVPVGQYYQFYRALKDRKKDVRLLLFPREGHGFRERKHIEKFYREVFKWLKERR